MGWSSDTNATSGAGVGDRVSYVKSVTFDCRDALVVARFWAGALGGELDEDSTSDKAYVEAPA